jgi:Polysaccharide biosynthesis protein
MVGFPSDPPRHASIALSPHIAPIVRHAGWFAIFLLLAPIVGPRGYGLFMLALSVIAIVETVLVETATAALINIAQVEERCWSTAFLTLIVIGAALSLAFLAASGALSNVIGGTALDDMFWSLAVLPLLGALTVVPIAALRRAGRERAIVAANAAGITAGAGVALALASGGAGPWSLVAQLVVHRLVECTVLWGMPGERIGLVWSRRYLVNLIDAVDRRAWAAAWPGVSRYAPCFVVGLALGPTAAGLVMLASRLAEAVADIFLIEGMQRDPISTVQRACAALLSAVLASALAPMALLPLLDLRWWGAVLPAQILLLGVVPASLIFIRSSCAKPSREPGWQAAQALGGIAVAALVAPYGLAAFAATSVTWTLVVALASLRPICQGLRTEWQTALATAIQPCAGAVAAGGIAFALAGPVASALEPVSGLCLLTAAGWLVYLVIRGEPMPEQQVSLTAELAVTAPHNPSS